MRLFLVIDCIINSILIISNLFIPLGSHIILISILGLLFVFIFITIKL